MIKKRTKKLQYDSEASNKRTKPPELANDEHRGFHFKMVDVDKSEASNFRLTDSPHRNCLERSAD